MKRILLVAAVMVLGTGGYARSDEAADAKELAKVMEKLPAGTMHEHLMMPLRDGVKLATEVFLPTGEGPWPVVLLRTPYSRWDTRGSAIMGGAPCVIVLQNQRGRYGSEGALPFESFDNEVDDSYDAIEWCAKQKWCNGKVGMWGPSGHGVGPCNAVWSKAPHLAVVDVNITADNAYLHWSYNNGCRRAFYSWLSSRGQKVTDWPRPTTSPFDMKAREKFLAERAKDNQVVFISSAGWFDLFSEGALDTFAALAPNGRSFVRMGPGAHGPFGGDVKYPTSNYPKGTPQVRSKDVLSGDESALPGKSALLYFLMGDARNPAGAPGNVWKVTDHWPVENTPTSYYMHKDGTLSTARPTEKDASLSYRYDPKDPVQSVGGNYAIGAKNGPYDQRSLLDPVDVVRSQGVDAASKKPLETKGQARKDVLRFVTEPLAEPVGFTGKVFVDLHYSSDAPDTEFVAKVVDIYPDGYEALIRESAMLARYWQGLDQPAPLEKGKVYSFKMDCWSAALIINKGHRIGVYITSSSNPAYEVHPNTYQPVDSIDKAVVARNTIHLSADHPSSVILPVIPAASYAQ